MSEQTINSPLTFRGSLKNRQQLKELAKLWGENSRSKVILRCIEWAWMVEIGSGKIDTKPSEVGDRGASNAAE